MPDLNTTIELKLESIKKKINILKDDLNIIEKKASTSPKKQQFIYFLGNSIRSLDAIKKKYDRITYEKEQQDLFKPFKLYNID